MQWHAYGDWQYTRSRYLLVWSASPSDSWALVTSVATITTVCIAATIVLWSQNLSLYSGP